MEKVFFSHKTDDWATPKAIYKTFMTKGFYDPCPFQNEGSLFGKNIKQEKIYINPPFSQNKFWTKYAIELYQQDKEIWLCIPARTDTTYFRKLFESAKIDIVFISGRISFNDIGKAPFPVLFIHIHKNGSNKLKCLTVEEFLELLNDMYQ